MTETTRQCKRCLEEKAITEFNFRDKVRCQRQRYCRDCTRAQVRRHYLANTAYYLRKAHKHRKRLQRELHARLVDYLHCHPCIDCGEADLRCLEFDHVRGIKHLEVSRMLRLGYSWEAIEAEINKCDVRCANCHRKRHAKQRGFWLSAPGSKPL
jgi:hypothetical protein